MIDTCSLCERPIISNIEAGIKISLSTLVLPFEAAKCLAAWGIQVYHVRLYGRKITYELWSAAYEQPKDGWLVMQHECSRDKFNWQFNPPTYLGTYREPKAKALGVRGFDD